MVSHDSPGLSELVAVARDITATVIAGTAGEEDESGDWPRDPMKAPGQAGLLGLNVPSSLGGRGAGLAAIVAITEVIARESPSAALCFAMHCVATAVIAVKATDDQKQRYLRPIAAGDHITSLALSEPGTGSHLYVPGTALREHGDEFEVRGVKSFISSGGEADSYVVSTVGVGGDAVAGTFSCILVDGDVEGLEAAASDAAVPLTNEAMTLCGGIAYQENSRLSRLLRDARAGHVVAPTTGMLKMWMGRALVDLPLL